MDSGKYIFLCSVLHVWYELFVDMTQKWHPFNQIGTGTFWLVQGTSLMPFFAVGTMYSPTGNTLEGMQTAEYSATVGKFSNSIIGIHSVEFVNMFWNRTLLRLPRNPHLHLFNLLHSHECLPLPCAIFACDHLWAVCRNLFPNGIG
jgi:hypothetical protein